jgi:glycopeptide antibiotics resistance protein
VGFEQLTHHEWYEFLENLIGNVILFMPLPVILALMSRLKGRKIFFVCLLTSISIEIVQYVLGIGIMDVDDVILNSLGAALGLWAYAWYKKRWYPILK